MRIKEILKENTENIYIGILLLQAALVAGGGIYQAIRPYLPAGTNRINHTDTDVGQRETQQSPFPTAVNSTPDGKNIGSVVSDIAITAKNISDRLEELHASNEEMSRFVDMLEDSQRDYEKDQREFDRAIKEIKASWSGLEMSISSWDNDVRRLIKMEYFPVYMKILAAAAKTNPEAALEWEISLYASPFSDNYIPPEKFYHLYLSYLERDLKEPDPKKRTEQARRDIEFVKGYIRWNGKPPAEIQAKLDDVKERLDSSRE